MVPFDVVTSGNRMLSNSGGVSNLSEQSGQEDQPTSTGRAVRIKEISDALEEKADVNWKLLQSITAFESFYKYRVVKVKAKRPVSSL